VIPFLLAINGRPDVPTARFFLAASNKLQAAGNCSVD
jgi:hypothetical protein